MKVSIKLEKVIHQHYGQAEDVVQFIKESWDHVSDLISNYTSDHLPDHLPDHMMLIEMKYAAINPADINMLEGRYYTQPELPSALGNEGVGVVKYCGNAVTDFEQGDHIIVPFKDKGAWVGCWASHLVVPARDCLRISKTIPLKQAAMLTINPPTAFQLLQLGALNKGDFVIQNAANSGVGRWVIYLAKKLGFKTINLVRREDLMDELYALGADYVYLDEPGCVKTIKQEVGYVNLAINGVGGESALACSKCLAPKGKMITYGAMSKAPITIGNAALIYKDNQFLGFNRTRWTEEVNRDEVLKVYHHILEFLAKEPYTIPIEQVYPLNQAKEALLHAQKSQRNGKLLFEMNIVNQ